MIAFMKKKKNNIKTNKDKKSNIKADKISPNINILSFCHNKPRNNIPKKYKSNAIYISYLLTFCFILSKINTHSNMEILLSKFIQLL